MLKAFVGRVRNDYLEAQHFLPWPTHQADGLFLATIDPLPRGRDGVAVTDEWEWVVATFNESSHSRAGRTGWPGMPLPDGVRVARHPHRGLR